MKRILVVEDDAPLCWQIERRLRGRHTVTLIDNVVDAMQWLDNNVECDLIIIGVQANVSHTLELLGKVMRKRRS